MIYNDLPEKQGLYDPRNEHDACGIGAIVSIKGVKSHKIIKDALGILYNLEHRGGRGAEDNTGDGAGILFQLPHKFFKNQSLGFEIGDEGDYAVAQLFVSRNEDAKKLGMKVFEEETNKCGLQFLGFREVPVNPADLGKTAVNAMPYIVQCFVKRPSNIKVGMDFERELYIARRQIEKKAIELNIPLFYICSFSSKTIVYKGMLISTQVTDFFLDLQDLSVETAIALVHSRFSTNTFPSWERAHPNRYIIHNGEINTIRGNVNSIKAREGLCKSNVFKDLNKVFPIIAKPSSDSAMFDNTVEFLLMNGKSLAEIFMMVIPEAWTKNKKMDEKKKAFYEYNSTMMEPWDGPASVVSTDGTVVVASLDRNGFRPSRYYVTNDDYLILSSETGAININEENIKIKSRLEPGKLLLVDTAKGRLISDEEIKNEIASLRPYQEWVKENLVKIDKIDAVGFKEEHIDGEELSRTQKAFGYTYDELTQGIQVMAQNGEEKLVSMGNDTPLAILSDRHPMLYSYFKQLFAQVTNPPLDAIREEIVTSHRIYLGSEGNILNPTKENCRRVKINQPVITNEELYKIRNLKGFKSVTLSILYDYKNKTLKEALDDLFIKAEKEIKENNAEIIIISDKGVNDSLAPMPALLALSGLHQYLVKKSLRTHTSLIVETGEPREVHHFACLIGFGATAVCPYLAYDSIKSMIKEGMLNIDYNKAVDNYVHACIKGIVKIASKMGLSTLQSYQGAQLFECIGISSGVIDEYFTSTANNIEGITLDDISDDTIRRHKNAYSTRDLELDSEGLHGFRSRKETHLYDPMVIYKLQNSCKTGNYQEFKEYTKLVDSKLVNLRNLMDLDFSEAISIDEVEPVESIVKRFKTGAMSYGSISEEAHKCLAIAMNRIKGQSNTGEGGENPERFVPMLNGDSASSSIKQVASGRFGVTIDYLTHSNEIQIKMAQGAKPGEGGQLPGTKVYPWIAKARHSTPGVTLISPPPHHDIYSIEDLAQLIYDLKNANNKARISVKLVAESGVGTVAAGVAKAGANVILISGYDGGTGASPKTSIANTGIPWELGLAEAHQTLIMNGLRDRVRVETDGKLMTGRDLAIACLLGAEEFGFATAPLIVMGCTMMRVCNLNTCPFGIATQSEQLRARFKGNPDHVVNFMHFIAEELREYMAKLGFKTVDEMVGRTDKLSQKKMDGKPGKVDLSRILNNRGVINKTAVHFKEFKSAELENTIDERTLLPLCKKAIDNKEKVNLELEVRNVNRSFATRLSSEITRRYGANGLDDDTITIKCVGTAGNSFGAFVTKGITLKVVGDVNDYLGKGLSGGCISVSPSPKAKFDPSQNIIVGNVCLYGATSGDVYIDGFAGERFCVRNSGATAVVMGVGAHGCEYMTGGNVIILGEIGRNFAAGMSGGVAYIYGLENKDMVNTGLVDIKELTVEDEKFVKKTIKQHVQATSSKKAAQILRKFDKNQFFKVMPRNYELMLNTIKEMKNKKDPVLSAFLKITGGEK